MKLSSALLLLAAAGGPAFCAGNPVLRTAHPFPGSRFFLTNDQERHTSVVMLHGSEGGSVPYIESEATILTSQGFAVLTLCYFD